MEAHDWPKTYTIHAPTSYLRPLNAFVLVVQHTELLHWSMNAASLTCCEFRARESEEQTILCLQPLIVSDEIVYSLMGLSVLLKTL